MCWAYFPEKVRCRSNLRIARKYLMGTMILWLVALSLRNEVALALTYISLSTFAIGIAYRNGHHGILQKSRGQHPLLIRLIFFPYLAGSYLNFLFQKKRIPLGVTQISEKFFIGPRLNKEEFQKQFPNPESVAVIDLCPEMIETPFVVDGCFEYHHIPFLDLSVPDEASFAKAIETVLQVRKRNPRHLIYIHCALGLSRSSLLASALLISEECRQEEGVIAELKEKNSWLHFPEPQRVLLSKFSEKTNSVI